MNREIIGEESEEPGRCITANKLLCKFGEESNYTGHVEDWNLHKQKVNVPDWSKIFRVASVESLHELDENDEEYAWSQKVNVPDWSELFRADSVESLHELDENDEDGDSEMALPHEHQLHELDEDDEDGDSEMAPPHEYLARECARSQKMAATSVFEGVGRTLKGRDMRQVRDAVWSQTGFDG